MDPFSLISAGVGGLGAIGGIVNMFTSGSRLKNLMSQDPTYTANPVAAQRLGLANTLLNARMPGATAMERNIYGNQANQLANVNRNATDSSQALAMGAAAQGQTNQAFQNLSTQEQQDYYNRLQNLTGAQQGMIAEGDKVYQDKVRRFQDMAGLTGAGMQNTQQGWNSIANLGFGGASLASQFAMMRQPQASSAMPYSNSYMGMQPVSQGGGVGQGYMPGGGMGYINPYQNQGIFGQ